MNQTSEDVALWTSGLIGLWFRLNACEEILARNLDSDFDWFCFVRSDFFWEHPIPLPAVQNFNALCVMQGEEYGGINDRFALVPRSFLAEYRDTVAGIFRDSDDDLIDAARA